MKVERSNMKWQEVIDNIIEEILKYICLNEYLKKDIVINHYIPLDFLFTFLFF